MRGDDSERATMWNEAPKSSGPVKRKDVEEAVLAAAAEGNIAAAMRRLTSAKVLPFSEDVAAELRRKHPSGDPVPRADPPAEAPMTFTERTVAQQLRYFPRGTAPGPCGYRLSYLLDCMNRNERMLKGLTSLCNAMASGKCPASVQPFFCGANLIALEKKGGGARPIAVGSILRRLTAKCVMDSIASEATSFLSPFQVGVGVPGGGEAIPHLLRNLHRIQGDDFLLLKVDFENAFNMVQRKAFIDVVRESFPSIFEWVQWCYGGPSHLFYGDSLISSAAGVQQGDPLGPFLFCLALDKLVKTIDKECGLKTNKWYLDDGALGGEADALQKALEIIRNEGPSLGLHVNISKCEICGSRKEALDQFTGVIKRMDNFDIVGTPIGSHSFCEEYVSQRIDKIRSSLDALARFHDSQTALILLRYCASFCKVIFTIRTCPPEFIRKELARFDSMVKDCFHSIIGTSTTSTAWIQATLPLRLGGFGLRSSLLHSPAAFSASILATAQLLDTLCTTDFDILAECHFVEAVKSLTEAGLTIEERYPYRQKELSYQINTITHQKLINGTTDKESLIRLHGISAKHASAWLTALPTAELKIDNFEYKTIIRLWLGLPAREDVPTRCPRCNQYMPTPTPPPTPTPMPTPAKPKPYGRMRAEELKHELASRKLLTTVSCHQHLKERIQN